MEQAGHIVPLIAERGYHIRAAAGEWPAYLPPLVFEDRAMIVTRFADTVQAASFVEFHSPGAPPDPRKWARLERHVRELGLRSDERRVGKACGRQCRFRSAAYTATKKKQ